MNEEVSQNHVRTAYQEAARSHQIRFATIGGVLALLLVPAGATLDYAVYPRFFYEFLLIRIICDFFIASVCALYFTSFGHRYFRIVSFVWISSIQISICTMIFLTGQAASSYYAGLNLVILATGVVLPLAVSEIMMFSAVTFLFYLVTCLLLEKSNPVIIELYNNFYFITLTAIISATASFFHERRRYDEFRFSYELGSRNKKLAEMDRLKTQFVANISHELRTPLTLIISPLQDLLQSSNRLPDRIASTLAVTRNNALRLLKLVNDLLDVIRLEEGKASLERRPVKLSSVVGGVIDSSLHLAEARGVSLIKQISDDDCVILGDTGALEKIFFNLLSNSLKFTPADGTITVNCRCVDDRAQVEVIDTGIGIGADDLVYIFDRFRQVDSSSTRRYAGTGLGLALVKDLTEAQGGEVNAHSRLGEGTTMSITFPLCDQNVLATASVEVAQPGDGEYFANFGAAEQIATLPLDEADNVMENTDISSSDGRPVVLVVDDEPDMRRYLIEMLSEEYRVLQALNGNQALELIRARRPDLVVLDLMLPELDGLAVCRLVKSDATTSAIKLILLTARVDETAKLNALDEGADDFLTKPFSSVEVRTRLRNLLRTAQLETDLRQRNDSLERTLVELRRTEAQLVQSEKLNALGSLAAGLLHEVNNPLNYAMTALQVARNEPDVIQSKDLSEIFGDIDEGMQRIRGIVTDLRAFAYPDKDEHRVFVFSDVLNSAQQFTAHELRGIEIEREMEETDEVVGSRNHIVQVLVNLFGNAAKAIRATSDQRTGLIRIVTRVTDGRLSVSVSDNGIGMSEDVLSRIFDPFYTTADVGEGMGLGLSICYTIIRNHGGTLVARSTSGEGTEFSFDLTLAAQK